MNGRNKLTVLMVIVILSCSSLAATITIKDRNQIVNDFQNFVNDPFTWDDYRDNNGFLNLYISGNTVENDTEESMMSLCAAAIEIYQLILVITSIEFKIQGEDKTIKLSDSPFIIDLKDINNTRDLIDVFEIQENQYSALHLYYDQEIIAKTNQGNKTLDVQGSGFFSIPIQYSNSNRTQTNITVEKDMSSNLLLSFQMQIRWQQMLIIPNIYGYKNF